MDSILSILKDKREERAFPSIGDYPVGLNFYAGYARNEDSCIVTADIFKRVATNIAPVLLYQDIEYQLSSMRGSLMFSIPGQDVVDSFSICKEAYGPRDTGVANKTCYFNTGVDLYVFNSNHITESSIEDYIDDNENTEVRIWIELSDFQKYPLDSKEQK